MKKWIERWSRQRKACNLAETTVQREAEYARRFVAFSRIERPSEITPKHLADYRQHVGTRNYAPGTTAQMIRAMRDIVLFLRDEGQTLIDPDRYVFYPRVGRKLPRGILTEKEVGEILRHLRRKESSQVMAIVELFYATGIRRMELINLDLYDIDLRERTLWVREGKGGRDRVLPVTRFAARAVKEYVEGQRNRVAGRWGNGDDALFLSARRGYRITKNIIHWTFRKLTKEAKLGKPIEPHLLRHSMATHLLRRGVDIRFIQAMLGHACLSTTEIYTQLDVSDVKREIDKHHPRNRMKI